MIIVNLSEQWVEPEAWGTLATLGGPYMICTRTAIGCSILRDIYAGDIGAFSETLDPFGSWTIRKYPDGYLVRDAIAPWGLIRWVRRRWAETCERSHVELEVGGEKIAYLFDLLDSLFLASMSLWA